MSPLSREQKYMEKVEALTDNLVELTRAMVRIPSENPPGDETQISELVGEELKAIGFEVEYITSESKRVNTLATLKGVDTGKSFLYNGHYDTVPAGNIEFWTVNPFEAVVKNGRIYGRGASDMKGSIASAIIAARAMTELGIKLKGDFHIHAVADEETGSRYGTRHLVERGYVTPEKVDMVVVGEGSVYKSRIHIRTAVRGLHWFKIISKGKSAHSSRPEEGVNAVLNMCRILLALNEHRFSFTPHSLLPDPTIASGTMIHGGIKENMIPELCEAVCDIRVIPGMKSKTVLEEVKSLISSLKEEIPELKADVKPIFWWPPSETSTSEEIFKVAKRAVKTAVGYNLMPRGTSGSNDTSWITNVAKIPAVAFGPGDNYRSGAHGPDEWVSIDRLLDFAKIYGLMVMEICGVKK